MIDGDKFVTFRKVILIRWLVVTRIKFAVFNALLEIYVYVEYAALMTFIFASFITKIISRKVNQ